MYKTVALSCAMMTSGFSLASYQKDVEAIQSMAGCYEVEFSYKETATAPGVEPSADYQNRALEWVSIDEFNEDRISLQHILLIGQDYQIKHWRQVWEYENPTGLSYSGFDTWHKEDFNIVDGAWVQRVYQVDDGPRYECSATWAHGENSQWTCASWAPLPRREFSKRDDYDVMARGNTHLVNQEGWLHIQDNQKLKIEEDGSNSWLGDEQGLNTYKRVADSRCASAANWWSGDRRLAWGAIQKAWQVIVDENQTIAVADHPSLSRTLNQLAEQFIKSAQEMSPEEMILEAESVIRTHVN